MNNSEETSEIDRGGDMTEKSAKRVRLEASLAEDPTDTFLRYGVALQCLNEGDIEEGRARLISLIADHPEQVPAYQQLGQSFMQAGDEPDARAWFQQGIAKAKTTGDFHAASEMEGFLSQIG